MEEIRSTVLEILEDLHPDIDFETYDAKVDGAALDSFDIISLIAEIGEELDVVITADKITPENFASVDAICNLISSIQDED